MILETNYIVRVYVMQSYLSKAELDCQKVVDCTLHYTDTLQTLCTLYDCWLDRLYSYCYLSPTCTSVLDTLDNRNNNNNIDTQ